jgi:hypothetical protein
MSTTPTAPSPEVMAKLEEASARRLSAATSTPTAPPPQRIAKEATVLEAAAATGTNGGAPSGVAGCATAKYVLADHYFGGSSGTIWAFDGTTWRGAGAGEPADEAGIEHVAFAANRVDVCWNANDALTFMRCWKFL